MTSNSSDPFERIDANLQRLSRLTRYGEQNRSSLLFVHAFISLTVTFWWILEGTWYSFVFGPPPIDFLLPVAVHNAIGIIGGLCLWTGLLVRRYVPLELTGLVFIFVWYIIGGFTFIQTGTSSFIVSFAFARMIWVHMETAYRILYFDMDK